MWESKLFVVILQLKKDESKTFAISVYQFEAA